jgi:hypothetical protein
MGNSESQQESGTHGAPHGLAASPDMRTCYYEVLQVERSDATTTDDIKKVASFSLISFTPESSFTLLLGALAHSLFRHTVDWL